MFAYNVAVMNSINQNTWTKSPDLCPKVFITNDNQNCCRVSFSVLCKASNLKGSMITGHLHMFREIEGTYEYIQHSITSFGVKKVSWVISQLIMNYDVFLNIRTMSYKPSGT